MVKNPLVCDARLLFYNIGHRATLAQSCCHLAVDIGYGSACISILDFAGPFSTTTGVDVVLGASICACFSDSKFANAVGASLAFVRDEIQIMVGED